MVYLYNITENTMITLNSYIIIKENIWQCVYLDSRYNQMNKVNTQQTTLFQTRLYNCSRRPPSFWFGLTIFIYTYDAYNIPTALQELTIVLLLYNI